MGPGHLNDPKRNYVTSLVEESLGLVRGHLERYPLGQDLVDRFVSVLRGEEDTRAFGRPVLEELLSSLVVDLSRSALNDDGFFIRKARWPKGSRLAVCLTHDVDNITRPKSHLWKTRSRFTLSDVIGGLLGVSNPYDNIGRIRSKEGQFGFRSSFYLLTSNYPLDRVKSEVERARRAGWEVGLHGDFGTHDSLEKMNEAVSRFQRGFDFLPTGLREHYLKFDFAKSWSIMDRAGFTYDTTVGTNDRLGFKLGLASPFRPPDADLSPLNLLEIPLTLMDTTLWGYLKESEDQGFADAIRFLDMVEQVEGLFTLLWHQEAVRMKGGRIYWSLLQEFKGRGCYVATGAEVSEWWRARSIPLIREGKLIRLAGEPPKDLVLRLDAPEETAPKVRSATLEKSHGGAPRLVKPAGPGFELELA